MKIGLALLLLVSVTLAYLGPPPQRRVGLGLRITILSIGMSGYLAALAAFAAGAIVLGALVLALAGELVCAAGWLSRGDAPPSDDDGDDGGGGGGRNPSRHPPIGMRSSARSAGMRANASANACDVCRKLDC